MGEEDHGIAGAVVAVDVVGVEATLSLDKNVRRIDGKRSSPLCRVYLSLHLQIQFQEWKDSTKLSARVCAISH